MRIADPNGVLAGGRWATDSPLQAARPRSGFPLKTDVARRLFVGHASTKFGGLSWLDFAELFFKRRLWFRSVQSGSPERARRRAQEAD